MTDKEKILAKIEFLLNETNYEPFTDEVFGRIQILKELKSYIDSLQEEPVSEEWIDVAKQYVKEHVIGIDKVTFSIATDMFISGAKWQKQKTIEKACEYLDLHCNEVKTEDNGIAGWIDNEFINNFKQAMKDE